MYFDGQPGHQNEKKTVDVIVLRLKTRVKVKKVFFVLVLQLTSANKI